MTQTVPPRRVLACDTSTRVATIALLEDGGVTAEWTFLSPEPRSGHLQADIDRMLTGRGLKASDLDLLVTSLGPGSFTGVRVAIATMKGLAFATGRPLVGVCSLDALAAPLLGRGMPVLAAFDARRHEVYGALYGADGATLLAPATWDAARLAAAICDAVPAGDVLGVGEGVHAYRAALHDGLGGRLRLAAPWEHVVRASVIAALGAARAADIPLLDDLEPLYLRRSEAELKREAREQA